MTTTALHYKVRAISLPAVNWRLICIAMFFVCLSLLVYYVWQVRYLTGGSYMVEKYESQMAKLLDEKRGLEVSFAKSGFLGQVQQKVSDLNFEKTKSVRYIRLPDNYLARAR